MNKKHSYPMGLGLRGVGRRKTIGSPWHDELVKAHSFYKARSRGVFADRTADSVTKVVCIEQQKTTHQRAARPLGKHSILVRVDMVVIAD
jgi:hypothetical protein